MPHAQIKVALLVEPQNVKGGVKLDHWSGGKVDQSLGASKKTACRGNHGERTLIAVNAVRIEIGVSKLLKMERDTGLEPVTSSLGN